MLKHRLRVFFITWGTFIIFCLMILVFSLAIPGFPTWMNAENIIKQTAVFLLIAFGVLLSMIVGEIDLSYGGTIGIAGAFFAKIATDKGSPLLGMAVAVAITIGFGALNGLLIARFRLPSFLVSLALMFVGMGGERLYTHGLNIWVKDLSLLKIFNGKIAGIPHSAILIIGVFSPLWFVLTQTKLGLHFRAVGENVDAAREAGINVAMVKFIAFTLAGLLYGIGTIFDVLRVSGSLYRSGQALLLPAMTACFIGATMFMVSKKNVVGTLVGAFFLTLVMNGLTILGAKYYFVPFTQGLILIAAIIIANSGRKGIKIQQIKF